MLHETFEDACQCRYLTIDITESYNGGWISGMGQHKGSLDIARKLTSHTLYFQRIMWCPVL